MSPAFEELIERKPAGFGGLLYDLIADEHYLRHAVGMPGVRDSVGLVAAMDMERAMLARDLESHGLPAVRLAGGGYEVVAGVGEVELELDLGDREDAVFELFRMLGSRRSQRQVAAHAWRGDLSALLPPSARPHAALPEADLVE